MKKKKYGQVFGFIIFCLIFLGFNKINAAVLEDKAIGYKITYPNGWNGSSLANAPGLIKANINKDSATGLQLRIYPNPSSDLNAFLQGYLDDFLKQMQSNWGGEATISDQGYRYVGGNNFFVVIIDFNRGDGQQWLLKQYILMRGDKVYVFQCGMPSSARAENEAVFDSIAGSLEFL